MLRITLHFTIGTLDPLPANHMSTQLHGEAEKEEGNPFVQAKYNKTKQQGSKYFSHAKEPSQNTARVHGKIYIAVQERPVYNAIIFVKLAASLNR